MTDAPTPRLAARVLVIDARDRVLLLRGCDPARPQDGTWWLTPGGGVDDGESFADAARRELREETGLDVDVQGPVVLERKVVFDFEGIRYAQFEHFFVVRVDTHAVVDDGWTELERRSVLEHRWWSVDELAATDEMVYPEGLVTLLGEILGAE